MFLLGDYQQLRLFEGIFSEYAAYVEPVCMYSLYSHRTHVEMTCSFPQSGPADVSVGQSVQYRPESVLLVV